ncbi:hypothetical protein RJ55_00885 [Drechmeria coniospora]|nr:hypothetical protein RJ55_00885 [Drechmeria coniospora]
MHGAVTRMPTSSDASTPSDGCFGAREPSLASSTTQVPPNLPQETAAAWHGFPHGQYYATAAAETPPPPSPSPPSPPSPPRAVPASGPRSGADTGSASSLSDATTAVDTDTPSTHHGDCLVLLRLLHELRAHLENRLRERLRLQVETADLLRRRDWAFFARQPGEFLSGCLGIHEPVALLDRFRAVTSAPHAEPHRPPPPPPLPPFCVHAFTQQPWRHSVALLAKDIVRIKAQLTEVKALILHASRVFVAWDEVEGDSDSDDDGGGEALASFVSVHATIPSDGTRPFLRPPPPLHAGGGSDGDVSVPREEIRPPPLPPFRRSVPISSSYFDAPPTTQRHRARTTTTNDTSAVAQWSLLSGAITRLLQDLPEEQGLELLHSIRASTPLLPSMGSMRNRAS